MEEKRKHLKIQTERKKLQDEKKTLLSSMKEKYNKVTSKAEYDNIKALGDLEIELTECDLKIKAKNAEVKELQNRALKK